MSQIHFRQNHVIKCCSENIRDKNPENWNGNTLLYWAAINGRFDVFELILENVENKNPAHDGGNTPLHKAASYGHFNICKLIIENVKNKHPVNDFGHTPKDYVSYKRLDILKLFE